MLKNANNILPTKYLMRQKVVQKLKVCFVLRTSNDVKKRLSTKKKGEARVT
jgi:hypothetical protein